MSTCIYLLNVVSRVCVCAHARTRVCVCVCDYISVADWLKILVVDWLFTMVHSCHFLRTKCVGAFSPLIGWKIPVDIGLCFMCLGMRGGVSMVCHRHAVANNPYIDNYDAARPSSYLMYLDCNNLYGGAMSEALPTGGVKWVRIL